MRRSTCDLRRPYWDAGMDAGRGLGGSFWRFWAASALANLGDGIRLAAFPLLAASLTDDPFAVAAVGAASSLPWLLTGLVAGSLADRRGARCRRHRAILFGSFAVTATVPALLLAAPAAWAALVVVITTSAGFGVLNVAAVSVRQRLTPAGLLGRIGAAWGTVLFGAEAVGGLGGGAIAAWQGLQAPFAVSAALGLLAVGLWWLSTRQGPMLEY
jgi:MFS family permease